MQIVFLITDNLLITYSLTEVYEMHFMLTSTEYLMVKGSV